MLMKPTKPAAPLAMTRPPKDTWIIGDACASTPIPAVTMRQRTAQRSLNCRVLRACCAVTLAEVTSACEPAPGGTQSAGRKPDGGTRTVTTPNIMNTR